MPSQLWRWEHSQLVNKDKSLVADVKGQNQSSGANAIAWQKNNGINQKWHFFEGK